jgi:hypothetical protein
MFEFRKIGLRLKVMKGGIDRTILTGIYQSATYVQFRQNRHFGPSLSLQRQYLSTLRG